MARALRPKPLDSVADTAPAEAGFVTRRTRRARSIMLVLKGAIIETKPRLRPGCVRCICRAPIALFRGHKTFKDDNHVTASRGFVSIRLNRFQTLESKEPQMRKPKVLGDLRVSLRVTVSPHLHVCRTSHIRLLKSLASFVLLASGGSLF